MKAICNDCGQIFEISAKVRFLTGSDYERYFICPFCKEKYSLGYYSDRVDAMIALHYDISTISEEQADIKKKYEIQ